jgi:peptidoglycan-N-acetylglucosamine deacetylase
MNRQIFFDPQRKRWKRLRRILDAVAVFSTVILVLFTLNVVRNQHLPELLLPTPRRNYRAIQEQAAAMKARYLKTARRKTSRKPSEIPFNSGEGLRAAYYVDDDAGSYASLKNHIHQIDRTARCRAPRSRRRRCESTTWWMHTACTASTHRTRSMT